MSIVVHAFCQSPLQFPHEEVVDLAVNGVLFDEAPEFEIIEKEDGSWVSLEITNRDFDGLILISHLCKDGRIEAIGDALSDAVGNDVKEETLLGLIRGSANVYRFDIPFEITDDAWDMLALIQIHLCRTCDGLLVASEGIYDRDLNLAASYR